MEIHFLFWLIFAALFIVVFIFDLVYTSHHKGKINIKAALMWSVIWIAAGFAFAILIYFYFPDGHTKSFEYIASYLIEKSLSVDNLFVFLMIFGTMGIPDKHQPRILKWGIIGAVVLRIIFILAGVQLLKTFSFMIYIFGAVLVYTAVKMFTAKDQKIHPNDNVFVKITKKFFPVKTDVETDHFFVKIGKKRYATVAFITLILIESTDLIFAIDSIPAVLAITHDSFIAITSNLFAILGLRSLFFALAGILNLFQYLKYGISFILLFIGIKMLISGFYHIPVQISLIVILAALSISVFASIVLKGNKTNKL
ncbi:MAG: TerC/Alx family metal homeostasis membrane protein [Ignavibacteriae bacterium]|jgi:tellurite resistance protein TerC|nr:TerC/Alx family metal homeostasis membrane protein [Ignavibacteriota bacterium]